MGFYFETYAQSLNKYGEELCGDLIDIAHMDDGSVLIVLSDGMGSGVHANILSALTGKIITSMIKQGAGLEDVVETIASTLPVSKENNTAYSTFSVLHIKQDGSAYLVEFDNPEALVLRRGKPLLLNRDARNVFGKTIFESNFTLRHNDMCLMFSDGAIHNSVGDYLNVNWNYDNVVEFLCNAYKNDITANAISKLFLKTCNNLYQQKPEDDTSIVACRVRKSLPGTIWIGPPVYEENDAMVVNRLMKSEGKKVICGTKTAQIASRILLRPLRVDLNDVSVDMPPRSIIEGVDLVTEGSVTLAKTLDILREYNSTSTEVLHFSGSDGASCLASLLIEQCTELTFLVGLSISSKKQSLDGKKDLNYKMNLIESLTKEVERMGKKVQIEYF